NIDLQKNKIQLYCNQVFVTDQVEGIVPEFLTLLHGVIDSPDIPLNVSRSYWQSDANLKKISTYITKKVADRLKSIFNENRKEYEEKWDDLKIFINYGMLTQDDFYDRAKDFALLKDVDGKYFTFEEYKTLIKGEQTDKNGTLVYLYANNKEEQFSYIETAKQRGYSVLLFDGQLDTPVAQMLEQKLSPTGGNGKGGVRFTRVDGDIIDRLIVKEDAKKTELTDEQTDSLSQVFKSQMPKLDKTEFNVEVQSLGGQMQPVVITQSEYMRRMKDMSRFQSGMGFYAQMPDMYSIVLNADHELVKKVLSDTENATSEALKPILAELKGQEARLAAIRQSQDKKKYDELTQEDKDLKAEAEKAVNEQKDKKNGVLADYAAGNSVVHQLIDLALLQNGMLKGAALDAFLKRSVEMIK
ncbi:MAG: molecular chaperone HtpG, partial [Prevotella sp.]|nr:molecular chaperone HtpG [Prevotella sp.]